jgi:hypothetical protein
MSLRLYRYRGSTPGLPAVHDRQANHRRGADSCASHARRYAQANEEGLIATGFKMHPADTPRKLGAVAALRERRVLVYQRPDGRYYL